MTGLLEEMDHYNEQERRAFFGTTFATKDVVKVEEGKASNFDTGKVRMDLLPVYPMKLVAEILTMGSKKYGDDNWRTGEPVKLSRHYAGVQRHLNAFWGGEDTDPESNRTHLAHAICGLMFMLELHLRHGDAVDDRCKDAVQW